jgi:hypothetical protein
MWAVLYKGEDLLAVWGVYRDRVEALDAVIDCQAAGGWRWVRLFVIDDHRPVKEVAA